MELDTVRAHFGDSSSFEEIKDRAAILVIIDNVDATGVAFSVSTNLCAGYDADTATKVVGSTLHRLAHALISGEELPHNLEALT